MSSSPMMTLGPVVFHLNTATYQNLQRSTEYKWSAQERLGIGGIPLSGGPAYQYISPGSDTMNIDGTIFPEVLGDLDSINLMRLAALQGIPWPLIQNNDSIGVVLGLWIIDHIDETQSIFSPGGSPRKLDFKLSLKSFNYTLGGML